MMVLDERIVNSLSDHTCSFSVTAEGSPVKSTFQNA